LGTILTVTLAGLAILSVRPGRAASTKFNITDGNWTNTTKWSDGAPHSGIGAWVGKAGGITCTIGSGDSVEAEHIQVARDDGTAGDAGTLVINTGGRLDMSGTKVSYIGHNANVTGTVTVAGGTLNGGDAARDVYFGYHNPSHGVLNISAGSVTNIDLRVATRNGTSGEINLSGTGLLVPGSILSLGVNANGYGHLNQTGGTLNGNNQTLDIGDAGTGVYRLSSGNATNLNTVYVGNDGVGRVELSGDGLLQKSGGTTYIGSQAGSTGTVVQTGGTWDHNSVDLSLIIGRYGVGVYTITNGLLTGLDAIRIGNESGSSGRLELSGSGRIERTSPGDTFLGELAGSTGTVVQTGGTWDQNDYNLIIGAAGAGTFSLSGGSITNINYIRLGEENYGHGTLNISGTGLIITDNEMAIGYKGDSTGVVTVAGGTLACTDDTRELVVGRYGTGSLTVSGGIVTNFQQLILGRFLKGRGTLEISGGTVYCEDLRFGEGVESTNTVRIIGSGADITFDDDITGASPYTTWHFAPDAGGISTIKVGNSLTYGSPTGTLEIDFSNFDEHTDELVLIDYNGNRAGEFVATNILTEEWSAEVEYDDTADQVKLVNIQGPPKGFVLTIK